MSLQRQLSFKNRDILKKYNKCSCFFCLKTFNTSKINEYIDENQTALCPFCGIDSVVCFKDGSLPSKEKLNEWHKHSFSASVLSPFEININKDRVHKYTTLQNARIYFMINNGEDLFLLIKEIQINGNINGFLLYDLKAKKQVIYDEKVFIELFHELSLDQKIKYYSDLKSCWNYRLVYSVKEMSLSVNECYYPEVSYTGSPSRAMIYINEINPEKLKENLMESFEWMLNAFAQPIIIDDSEIDLVKEESNHEC